MLRFLLQEVDPTERVEKIPDTIIKNIWLGKMSLLFLLILLATKIIIVSYDMRMCF